MLAPSICKLLKGGGCLDIFRMSLSDVLLSQPLKEAQAAADVPGIPQAEELPG